MTSTSTIIVYTVNMLTCSFNTLRDATVRYRFNFSYPVSVMRRHLCVASTETETTVTTVLKTTGYSELRKPVALLLMLNCYDVVKLSPDVNI